MYIHKQEISEYTHIPELTLAVINKSSDDIIDESVFKRQRLNESSGGKKRNTRKISKTRKTRKN